MKIEPHEILEGRHIMTVLDRDANNWLCQVGKRRFVAPIPEGFEEETPYECSAEISYRCIATYPKRMRGQEVTRDRTDCNYIVEYELSNVEVRQWIGPKKHVKFMRRPPNQNEQEA